MPLVSLVRDRIAVKLTLTALLFVLAIAIVMATYMTKTLEQLSVENLKQGLVTQARLAAGSIEPHLAGGGPQEQLQGLANKLSSRVGEARVTIIRQDGTVVGDSQRTLEEVRRMENHRERPEVKAALEGRVGRAIRRSSTLDVDMLYIAIPLNEGGEIKGALRLALSLDEARKAMAPIRRTVAIGVLIALGVALAGSLFIARRVTYPVVKMKSIAMRMADGDFAEKAPVWSGDEIGQLGRALNAMALRLEEKIGDLERERAQTRAILDSMTEGVIAVDPQGRVLLVNPSAMGIFHLPSRQVEGQPFLEVIRNKELYDLIQECRACSEERLYRRELALTVPVERVLQVHATPLRRRGETLGILIVLHDITELYRLEKVRTEFVANVSHELRTPLTSIKGYLETLLEGALEDQEHARRFLEVVFKHAERLGRLLDDLLDLSNIELGKVRLAFKPVSLREVLDDVLSIYRVQAEKKEVTLESRVPIDLPPVRADRDRLAQILVNLVDNAVKFTPQGGHVTVGARKRHGTPSTPDSSKAMTLDPHGDFVEIVVEDTGIGIPSWDLPRVTERFYRVDKARSRELGGTGLGLAIVKHLVQAHGGTLQLESELGKGTRILLTLPQA